jgi:pimeloyl-ACP methyl ester carboxylesterase
MSTKNHKGRTATVAGAAAAVVASLTSLASSPAAAEEQPKAAAKPTVVLVHGAFADASGWNKTAAQLRHQGFPVRAVSNPLRGLDYDTA